MIHTPRLTIRPFQTHDYRPLYDYMSNPIVYRFEPGEPISLDQAKQLVVERSQRMDFWAVLLTSTQDMVGHVFFKQTDPQEFLTWELGYIFNPVFQNNGYATEAAAALVQYGFCHFGIHRVMAHCNPENVASWKVLEKIGLRREGYFRKNIYFRKDLEGAPIWIDTFEYAILSEDNQPSACT